ncbi:hypothetical protein BDW22DRAFT_712780 [Trametopsis cervina]|nr:hypothetical protein BDW22DRAFT_712780 [Trametopsis cervina]
MRQRTVALGPPTAGVYVLCFILRLDFSTSPPTAYQGPKTCGRGDGWFGVDGFWLLASELYALFYAALAYSRLVSMSVYSKVLVILIIRCRVQWDFTLIDVEHNSFNPLLVKKKKFCTGHVDLVFTLLSAEVFGFCQSDGATHPSMPFPAEQ